MRVAVIGSRDFKDYTKLKNTLDSVFFPISEIISGGARGADSLAERYAEENYISLKVFRPDWTIGKHAGFLRNTQIIESCDVVVAFWDGVSKGTLDSIRKAEKIGKRVIKVLFNNKE